MNLRIHEDVVNVQLHGWNRLSGIDGGAGGQDGRYCDITLVVADGNGRSGTLVGGSSGDDLSGETEEQVTGSNEQDVGLSFDIDSDETLTVGDGDGGDGKAGIAVNSGTRMIILLIDLS